MPETQPGIWAAAQENARLESRLSELSQQISADALSGVSVATLNYAASGAALARTLLEIEALSRDGVGSLASAALPEPDDAVTVHTAAMQAIAAVNELFPLVQSSLQQPNRDRPESEEQIRALFHVLSNLLVSINCYTELMLLDSNPAYAAHDHIQRLASAARLATRLARNRATIQRIVNEQQTVGQESAPALERTALDTMIDIWCGSAVCPAAARADGRPEVEVCARSLPQIEGEVLRELGRRQGALGPVYAGTASR